MIRISYTMPPIKGAKRRRQEIKQQNLVNISVIILYDIIMNLCNVWENESGHYIFLVDYCKITILSNVMIDQEKGRFYHYNIIEG